VCTPPIYMLDCLYWYSVGLQVEEREDKLSGLASQDFEPRRATVWALYRTYVTKK
jgi:hypothetical protein